ncbi:glutamine-hydrolyzing GMP synthase [Candidatus Peregrinibacteria bacterium]|nr:glutamine-hydrolyzing GMP synthase [Candidatus Peregrinibacteria bacterium]
MDKIVVLDFGGQYAHLIANRIRKLGVYCEIRAPWTPAEKLVNSRGIILSGSPASVYDKHAPKFDKRIFQLGIPVLGICYGLQLMVHHLGGLVQQGKVSEYGKAEITLKKREGIFKDFDVSTISVWMSHGDAAQKLPLGFEVIAMTRDCPFAAIANFQRHFYGVQFHPEVQHTVKGKQILENFITICGAARTWTMEGYLEKTMRDIQKQVGENKVFMLVSGGVDSTVAFALLNKALGKERVYGLFIDTGLMRLNERIQVEQSLKEIGLDNLHVYDASKEFMRSLMRVYHPERKRHIIGNKFLSIQKRVAYKLNLNAHEWLIGQGTIYPDTIETGSSSKLADTIKTHHNRVPQIETLIKQGKIIEPLKDLYKDEVRELGKKIGLPDELVWRHPFPGPGLAVRCLCARNEEYPPRHLELEREINMCLGDTELRGKILPIKSVGVQGDSRTYRHPLVLFGDTDWDTLEQISTRLTNQFREINRVLYSVTPHVIENIYVMNRFVGPKRIFLLQKADKIVMDILQEKELTQNIWQFPVVLLPLIINEKGQESVVFRPVQSEEAMTANFAKIDWKTIHEMSKQILELEDIGAVFYDVTNKPPGTIEWE